jgi:thioredoxin 1
MSLIHANIESFDKITTQKAALIDFWAPWCMPCQMLTPVLEELTEEFPNLIIAKVNVDDEPELAMKYGINSIPCLMLFENGKLVNKSLGYMDKEQLIKKFNLKQ